MSRYTHWCPCGCGKKVVYEFSRDVEKTFKCRECNKFFSRAELLNYIGKYKRVEVFI